MKIDEKEADALLTQWWVSTGTGGMGRCAGRQKLPRLESDPRKEMLYGITGLEIQRLKLIIATAFKNLRWKP